MNKQQFLNNQNIDVLYEILLQELKINDKSIWIPQIRQIFKNNINFFLENANFNNSLLELNKLFLKQTTIAINRLIPNLKNEQKKINILPDEIIFPHKIEDIKNIRKDLFEEEFNLKKKDFENTMRVEKPNIINFSDNYANEKIVNMEQLLSDKILERDVQIETNVIKTVNITDINDILEQEQSKNEITINFNEIDTDDENINRNKNKKVNFNLKENDEIIPQIKTTVYEEQKSIKLPTDLNVINNKLSHDNSRNFIPSQFLPMNELVKKINELNTKVDNLTQIIEMMYDILKHKEG